MPISVQCKKCTKRYRLSDEKAGRRIRCRECRAVIDIPEKGNGHRKLQSHNRSQRGLLFAVIGGGVIVTAAIVWVIVAMTGETNEPKSNEQVAQIAKTKADVQRPTPPQKSTPVQAKKSPTPIPKKSPSIIVVASTGKKPKKKLRPRRKKPVSPIDNDALKSLRTVAQKVNVVDGNQDPDLVHDMKLAVTNAVRTLRIKQPNDTEYIAPLLTAARFLNDKQTAARTTIRSSTGPLRAIASIWRRSANNNPALRKQVAEAYVLLADQIKNDAGSNKSRLSNAMSYYRDAISILQPLAKGDPASAQRMQQVHAKLTAAKFAYAGKTQPRSICPETVVAPETAMRRPLSKPLNVDNKPLFESLTQFAELSKTQIVIDRPAFEDAGITYGELVSVKNQVTAGATLSEMLKKPELNWLIENGVVLVTTDAEYQDKLQTRVYQTLRFRGDFDSLIGSVKEAAAGANWLEEEGTGGMIVPIPPNAIAIQQTYHVLEIIEKKFRKDLKQARQPQYSTRFAMTGMRHPSGIFKSDLSLIANNTPLKDVIADLCKHAGIKHSFNQNEIANEGLSLVEPVNLRLKKLHAYRLLDLLLSPSGLVWVPQKDGSIVITTKTAANSVFVTATHQFDANVNSESVQEACMYSGQAHWEVVAGVGGTIKRAGPKALQIKHTYAAQLQVARLLAPLRANGK